METIMKRGFLLGVTLGHGEACFVCFTVNFMHLFIFRCVFGHYEAIKTTLTHSDCAVPKAGDSHSFHALINLFLLLAQFHCYMPGFSVTDNHYRLNHF